MGDGGRLATYPLRSSSFYAIAMVFAIAVAFVPFAIIAWIGMPPPDMWTLWLLFAVLWAVPIVLWSSAGRYRVPGGSGELTLFADRLELPGDVRLPYAGLLATKREIVNRYVMFGFVPVGEVVAERILVLRTERGRRELSGRLFEDPECVDAVLNDLALIAQGLPPAGLAGLHPPAATVDPNDPRYGEYEAQLDAELEELE